MFTNKSRITLVIVFSVLISYIPLGYSRVEADGAIITVPDDYPVIQHAIGNATDGDTIFIKNGTYKETITVNKRVNIVGENKSTTFIDGMGKNEDVIIVWYDNVTISGLSIFNSTDNGVTISWVDHVSIYDLNVYNCSDEGIYLTNSDYAIIENCTIYDVGDRGIYLSLSNHELITGCIIYNTDLQGIYSWNSHHSEVSNCNFSYIDHYGIFFESCRGVGIYDCVFYNTTFSSISSSNCYYLSIAGCEVYNCSSWQAVSLYTTDDSFIIASSIHDNTDTQLYASNSDNLLIAGCNISDLNDGYGIKLESCKDSKIVGCQLQNLGTAVYLFKCDEVQMLDSIINSNDYGVSLESSDKSTLCNITIYDCERGIRSRYSLRTYVTKSSVSNSTFQGIYMQSDSSMIVVCSNFTDNDSGIYGYKSVLRARYNLFKNNSYYGVECGALSIFNCSKNWWGNQTGPFHSSFNPNGTGDSITDYVIFEPWLTEFNQPKVLLADLRCQIDELWWRVIFPDDETPKPLGCAAAMVSDWLASAYFTTRLTEYEEGLDTMPGYVNQVTGEPLGDLGTGILTFGGPFVNPVVKRAENMTTPDSHRAPVRFHSESDVFYFQYRNGTNIPNASLPLASINNDEDLFVIERYLDGKGRLITICYGFGWQGTYAAGKFLDKAMFPNLGLFTEDFIIIKWEDTNGNGFVDNPGEDAYIPITPNILTPLNPENL